MKIKKLGSVLLCAAMLVMLAAGLSSMAFANDYTYTVRIYPGNNGSGSVAQYQVAKGTQVSVIRTADSVYIYGLSGQTITLDNEKYYIRGVRETGKDTAHAESFAVTQDTDLVVAYGMRGSAVEYTVYYTDINGAPMTGTPGSITGYGSVGESVVIGAYPVDGYLPYAYSADGILVQTYNITNSNGLSADPTENVFTFVYQAEAEAVTPETPAEAADTTAADTTQC